MNDLDSFSNLGSSQRARLDRRSLSIFSIKSLFSFTLDCKIKFCFYVGLTFATMLVRYFKMLCESEMGSYLKNNVHIKLESYSGSYVSCILPNSVIDKVLLSIAIGIMFNVEKSMFNDNFSFPSFKS